MASVFSMKSGGKVVTKSGMGDVRLEESEKTLNRHSGELAGGD